MKTRTLKHPAWLVGASLLVLTALVVFANVAEASCNTALPCIA